MYKFLFFIFLFVSIGLIVLIMCQQGRDAYMNFSFGSEISSVFTGMKSSGNFLTRTTSIFSILFFLLSLVMGNYYISIQEKKEKDFFKKEECLLKENQKE